MLTAGMQDMTLLSLTCCVLLFKKLIIHREMEYGTEMEEFGGISGIMVLNAELKSTLVYFPRQSRWSKM